MKAAITAAQKGHEVILADNRSKLGGQLSFTDYDDIKADLRAQKDYLAHMVEKLGIQTQLGTTVDRAYAERLNPDVIVVAAGATPIKPRLPGIEQPHVMGAVETYRHAAQVGARVVMIGGGLVGVETALFLADAGKQVTVVEMTDTAAREANRLHAEALRIAIRERNVKILTNTACEQIDADGVLVRCEDGTVKKVEADTVVYCVGLRANTEVYQTLYDCAPEVYRVGDCIKPGTIREAILTGYYTAMEL